MTSSKLKSAINGRYYSDDVKTNGILENSQLTKYMQWVDDYYACYQKKFYIFVPNYKAAELKRNIEENHLMPKDENNNDLYRIVTYKEIFDCFNSEKLKQKMCNDKYYTEFINSLSYHIYTADKDMERKFVNAIRKARNKENGLNKKIL